MKQFKDGFLTNTHALDGSSGCSAAAAKIREFGKTDAQLGQQINALTVKRHECRLSNARKCILSDGFVGNKPELVAHLKMPKGTVSAAMSKAFVSGSFRFKNNIIIYPYDSNK